MIIHYPKFRANLRDSYTVYFCNWSFIANPEKLTDDKSKVTCANCLRKLKKGDF